MDEVAMNFCVKNFSCSGLNSFGILLEHDGLGVLSESSNNKSFADFIEHFLIL
jgi:hypothetical protein